MIKILNVTTELVPFVHVTQMGNDLRFVAPTLQGSGYEVRLFMPKYGIINDRRNRLHEIIRLMGATVQFQGREESLVTKVASMPNARLQVYLIGSEKYLKYDKLPHVILNKSYLKRSATWLPFFALSTLKIIEVLDWIPDVIHCHGFPTAMFIPLIREKIKSEEKFKKIKTIFSVNLGYEYTYCRYKLLPYLGVKDINFDYALVEKNMADLRLIGMKHAHKTTINGVPNNELEALCKTHNIDYDILSGAPKGIAEHVKMLYSKLIE